MIDESTFKRLQTGDTSGFMSHSEADMAFCEYLAGMGANADEIDGAYRASGLMRDKWDRKQHGTTYGRMVIEKAIQNHSEQ